MSKRLYLKNWPPARNEKRFKCHSTETAVKFLRAYLNDEIMVCTDKTFRPRQVKPSETQILMQSVFIIGQRVIRKYGKGEVPHNDRMAIWRKCLAICDEFELNGLLPPPKQVFFERNDFIFEGRLYDLLEGGCFVVPEIVQYASRYIGNSFDTSQTTAFAGFPPLGKKAATRLIEAYNLSCVNSDEGG